MKKSVWLAAGIAPLVSFLVVPAVQFCFALLRPIDEFFYRGGFLNRGTIVAGLIAVIASYKTTLLVGVPSFFILRSYEIFSTTAYVLMGFVSGLFIINFSLHVSSAFWVSLTLASSLLVSWTFAKLLPRQSK